MVLVVVVVVVAVGHAVVRVLVCVLPGRLAAVRVFMVSVVVNVLVAVRHLVVLMWVLVLAHVVLLPPDDYQPWTVPTSTIGPVGLFEPPAGSMDTAKAVISVGRSSFATCVR